MDPITTLIVTSIAVGAAAGLRTVVEEAVRDAYAGLKRLIADSYADHPALMESVEHLAESPEDQTRQVSLGQALTEAGATEDPGVIEAAKAIHASAAKSAESYSAIGLDIEKIKASILEVEDIQASGTGVRMKEVEIEGSASFKGIRAGQTEPSDPN